MLRLADRPEWMQRAECRDCDPELFHAEPNENETVVLARKTCAGCEVRTDCLDYALDARELRGIWGGTTVRERRRLKRSLGLDGRTTGRTI